MKNKYLRKTKEVDRLLCRYKDFYNPDKHIIKPEEVDWYDFEKRGVILKFIFNDNMDCLLSGSLTNLIEVGWYDSVNNETKITGCVKLRIYKDEHGMLSNIIIPVLEKPVIPDRIFNYTLSEHEKIELQAIGRLERSIQVVVEKTKKLVLPYIDNETNQLMYRCMDLVKLPTEYKGLRLDSEMVKGLIYGENVFIEYETGNVDLVYLDPVDAKLKTMFEWKDIDNSNDFDMSDLPF